MRERGVVDFIDFIFEEGEPGLVVEEGLFHLDEEVLVELVVLLQEVPNHNYESAAIFFFYVVFSDGGAGVEHETDEVFDELSLFEYPACGQSYSWMSFVSSLRWGCCWQVWRKATRSRPW